ncbi:MAG: 2-oxo-4-hydroxy-4-carboxy-5-ureidoimidazoline decarboxylase [Chloroflexota bacterium]|nr:2-oxo-4-hydroxy-4-carboxy-5-ureidoimidazoline decarboxylase [Chloroflexota bacterium]
MAASHVTLAELNAADRAAFQAAVAPLFEGAPDWVGRAWEARPFADLDSLHDALTATMLAASPEEQVALIQAHPDLVGKAALAGTLTPSSSAEQAAAGLDRLTAAEIAQFTAYNAAYRAQFGFPFVICARENRKESILAAFPARLGNPRPAEIATALREIAKIVWLRLPDRVGPLIHACRLGQDQRRLFSL